MGCGFLMPIFQQAVKREVKDRLLPPVLPLVGTQKTIFY